MFVDFDGNIQLSTPETGGTSEAAPIETSEPESPVVHIQEQSPADFADVSVIEEVALAPVEDDYQAETSNEGEAPSDAVTGSETEGAPEIEWSEQSLEEQIALPVEPTQEQQPITEVNFSDVVEYANQTELDNTPLVYTLWIEGIDRKETRDKVIEVLKDIKFNLHLKEILPTIRGGVLELRDLNPVKTSLIATRLREEAVTFRWKQNVYQSEAAASGN